MPHIGKESRKEPEVKKFLFRFRDAIQALRDGGVARTWDTPVGAYGEWLVARAYRGTRQGNSLKGFDVLAPGRIRIQVKTRWLPDPNDSRQLSAIRNLTEIHFDLLVGVLLDREFDVIEAYEIPHTVVGQLVTRANHTNSDRLVLTSKVCQSPGCRNITAKIRAADPERRS